MRRTIYVSIVVICTFFAGEALAQKGPSGPTNVILAPVKTQSFSDKVEALGTTKANETVIITANTTEKVTDIHFEDGQEVKEGDLLVSMDQSEEKAELSSAEAMLSENNASYNRAKNLQNSNALSKGTLQERLAELRQSQAAVEEIKARMEKLSIKAPFDGILGLREVSVGTLAQPGTIMTTIDDLSQIKVDFDVPSIFLPVLKPGLPIIGMVDAYGEREFRGEVRTVNTQVDPVTRTITVRAVLPNEDKALKPGLLMKITLFKDQRQTQVIPEEALIKRSDKNYVYVAKEQDGKLIAQETEVTIGGRQPGIIEVLDGLKDGDQIITHGIIKIHNGSEIVVRAVEETDAPLDDLLQQSPSGGKEKN